MSDDKKELIERDTEAWVSEARRTQRWGSYGRPLVGADLETMMRNIKEGKHPSEDLDNPPSLPDSEAPDCGGGPPGVSD